MLTAVARSLLKIPLDKVLPTNLAELYDTWFAGRCYHTRFGSGWTFGARGDSIDDGFDQCLEHLTAQCHFYLDAELRVFVEAENPVQIASSFISLVEKDAILVNSVAVGERRRGFGTFPSMDAFMEAHGDYVKNWPEAPFDDPEFGRFYVGPQSVVGLGRCYSDEFLISGLEYF